MTDREMLELAAKAAGYDDDQIYPGHDGGLVLFEYDESTCGDGTNWNPLDDDGDALRLAVTCKIEPAFSNGRVTAFTPFNHLFIYELIDTDHYAATRRAIVRAAAEIGKEMK